MRLSLSSVEGAPLHWAWLSTSLGGGRADVWGISQSGGCHPEKFSLLTCAVGGGLERRPLSLGLPPGNFLEGAVARRGCGLGSPQREEG